MNKFYFSIIVDLQNDCQDNPESLCIPTDVFLLLTFYINMPHLPQLVNQYWYSIISQSSYFAQIYCFFSKRDVSFTQIFMYSIVYLSICTSLIDIFNIFCVITQHYFLFLLNFFTFGHWELFELALCPFEMFITGVSLFCFEYLAPS